MGKLIANYLVNMSAEDHIIEDDIKKYYKLGRTLGTGGYATVKKGKLLSDGSHWAVKIIQKSSLTSKDLENLKTEIHILKSVSHPNIVNTKDVYQIPEDSNAYIVMELMSGGELFDRIVEKECYNEHETRVAFRDVTNALIYLHDQGIVHRDLKPENLLYNSKNDNADLKIADFGLASIIDDGQLLHSACGTPGYVAPEILKKSKKKKKGYGLPVDMWSLGVILYILLSGCPPFYQEDQNELFAAIIEGDYDFPSPDWDDVSKEAVDLVKKLLCLNPKKRLTARQVLEHPFMTAEQVSMAPNKIALEKLKSYNAKRRFKKAIVAVQMINLMKSHAGGLMAMLKEKAKENKNKNDGETPDDTEENETPPTEEATS